MSLLHLSSYIPAVSQLTVLLHYVEVVKCNLQPLFLHYSCKKHYLTWDRCHLFKLHNIKSCILSFCQCLFTTTVNIANCCQVKAHEKEPQGGWHPVMSLSSLGMDFDSGLFTTCLMIWAFVFALIK